MILIYELCSLYCCDSKMRIYGQRDHKSHSVRQRETEAFIMREPEPRRRVGGERSLVSQSPPLIYRISKMLTCMYLTLIPQDQTEKYKTFKYCLKILNMPF